MPQPVNSPIFTISLQVEAVKVKLKQRGRTTLKGASIRFGSQTRAEQGELRDVALCSRSQDFLPVASLRLPFLESRKL